MRKIRTWILIIFGALTIASAILALNVQFTFSFEDFFPQDDPDLTFYQNFIEDFETDINFLLVAVERKEGVFEQSFLERFHDFSIKARDLPYIKESNSITQMSFPLKTPFGFTAVPAINIDQPEKYASDKKRLLADSRFQGSLIATDATSMVVALKTSDDVFLAESETLMTSLDSLASSYNFENYYVLGPAYFQKEMVRMQKREVMVSAVISAFLVMLVMFWIFRKPWGIVIALTSIGLGLLLFIGALSALGRPLNAMAALYPVLMIIVGTSDVVHIMSKYIDELKKGVRKKDAIKVTVKEIGLATLLTSVTTSIGFASLLTSKVLPIQNFGLNAALGVMIAFGTVIFFTTACLSFFRTDQLIKLGRGEAFWHRSMNKMYQLTLSYPKRIFWGCIGVFILSLVGISQITTNYRIGNNLPQGEKVSRDFDYFESKYAGFRPFELAVFAKDGRQVNEFAVLKAIDAIEQHLHSIPGIEGVTSITTVYKSISQMMNGNRSSAFIFPEKESTFNRYKKLADKVPANAANVLISRDKKKARISARVKDLGADKVHEMGNTLDDWINTNVDTSLVSFKQTGMGVILDKNARHIRTNLLQGLGLAILIISVLMVILFQNWRMVIISIVPNVFPLLLAAALIGFLGIELEAGVAIVFAIVFGIAVDDTIHFLSKFKLSRSAGKTIEESLHITFVETGKAICLTSLILFFGFLVMLFSIHPPSVTIGLLISLTLVSALLADLFCLPLLIRWLMMEDVKVVDSE